MPDSTTTTTARERSRGGRRRQIWRVASLVLAFLLAFGVGLAYASWALVCNGGRCPSVEVLDEYTPRETSKLYAADGRFIAEIGSERRTLIGIAQTPQVVRNAFLATEDKRFYEHGGIDWVRVPGSMWANLRAGGLVQGFSTITMQLAGNIFPERINRLERSGVQGLSRKVKEAKVARAIEEELTKDQILELYLNQIYLGNGAHGIETASQRYFGKSARELNLAEAATLAAIPKSPTRFDPRRFPDRVVQRRNTILELMRRQGLVSDADASLAKAYPLQLASRQESGDVAPYFVEWIRQQLDAQFGRRLYEQGLRVYTTLDVDLQGAAELSLENQMRAIESGKFGTYRRTSFEQYVARDASDGDRASANSPYLQAAFIAMDPKSGAVRALIGGRDFNDSKFNRATQAVRQPGSTFKPIVYAAAVQNGRPLSYVLDDSPLTVPQQGGKDWTPQNYDGGYAGLLPMRKSLYESRNVSTIRLGMELGEANVIEMARKFGISTPIPAYPSIHIGAAGTYPIEMVSAYSAFATLGTRAAPTGIVRVENQRGEVIWKPEPQTTVVMSPEESWLMVSVLKDVNRRGTAAGAVAGAGFNHPSGGKTGTTNDYSDVWYIGFTPDLVAGVWIGMDRPQRIMPNAQGGRLAAPAWTAFMKQVYRRKPAPADWPRPGGIIERLIEPTTGFLATGPCAGGTASEVFIMGTDPTMECSLYAPQYDTLGHIPGAPAAADTFLYTPVPSRVVPGNTAIPRRSPGRAPNPRDTAAIYRRDTFPRPPPPPSPARGTTPRDTIRPPAPRDTLRIPAPITGAGRPG